MSIRGLPSENVAVVGVAKAFTLANGASAQTGAVSVASWEHLIGLFAANTLHGTARLRGGFTASLSANPSVQTRVQLSTAVIASGQIGWLNLPTKYLSAGTTHVRGWVYASGQVASAASFTVLGCNRKWGKASDYDLAAVYSIASKTS